MSKFQVGDRVYCKHAYVDGVILTDRYGTVCHVHPWGIPNIGVKWDERLNGGHNCSRYCEQGHGFYVHEENIKLASACTMATCDDSDVEMDGDLL